MAGPVRTVRELAEKLGLAHSTVSMALRDHPKIAESTRRKVQREAEALGYARNPLVSSLMTQVKAGRVKSDRLPLAMLLSDRKHPDFLRSYRFYCDLVESAEERCHRLGYYLEPFAVSGPQAVSLERLRSILRTRNIVGVFVPPGMWDLFDDPDLQREARGFFSGLAAVSVGFSWKEPDLHRASPDHSYNARLAFRELKRMGATRIGMVVWESSKERTDNGWIGGFSGYQHRIPSSERVPILELKAWDSGAIMDWMRHFSLDGVICADDQMLDILEANHAHQPLLTAHLDMNSTEKAQRGIDQQPREIGAAAIDMLVAQINASAFGAPEVPRVTAVRGQWVDRTSTGR